MATLLQQAIDLAKSGKRDAAEMLIRQVLETDPNNEVAWMWLSGVSHDVLVKQEALKRVLQLNPDSTLAKEGLARFGGELPEKAEEPETPEFAPPAVAIPPEDIPIGNTGEPPAVIGAPPADIPPIIAPEASPADVLFTDTAPSDVDWSIDAFAEDLTPLPIVTEEAPVFNDSPGDFDFNFDEPPVFDFNLDELEAPGEPPALATDADLDFGKADEIPAVTIPPLADGITSGEEITSDRLEDALSHTDVPPAPADELKDEKAPDIEPEALTEAETLDEVVPEPAATDDIHNVLRHRRKRQNRFLIIAAIFFAIMVLGSCSLYYYVTEVANIYLLMPQLAGKELQVKAPKPKNGVSTLDFNGFPASDATIHWTEDNDAATCHGEGVGLKVDFNNNDLIHLYSNHACNNGACTFQADITPGPIINVAVTYICGKDAVITVHK